MTDLVIIGVMGAAIGFISSQWEYIEQFKRSLGLSG